MTEEQMRKYDFTKEDIEYIQQNYGKCRTSDIAANIDKSGDAVRYAAKCMNLKITKAQRKAINQQGVKRGVNLNPVTETTHMLICRYDYEKVSKQEISRQLGRTEAEIDNILAECRANGNYERYNRYGRHCYEKKALMKLMSLSCSGVALTLTD
nr:MAG TPA: helix-turn-helix domain protein [Caudoviricetes sp.]